VLLVLLAGRRLCWLLLVRLPLLLRILLLLPLMGDAVGLPRLLLLLLLLLGAAFGLGLLLLLLLLLCMGQGGADAGEC
jgi:hypothetical protein